MKSTAEYLAYSQTNSFSKIVIDYIEQKEDLKPFYHTFPSKENLERQVLQKQKQSIDRAALYAVLKDQYDVMPQKDVAMQQIELLKKENTFTITTAHQPNLLTGPLYFFYKIIHAIALAAYCQKEMPQYNFVPVYYMGSEDADVAELAHLHINGIKYNWATNQQGAFGRFLIDDSLLKLIQQLEGQLSIQPYGQEIFNVIAACFTKDKTIQQATLELVHHLLGKYGIIVLIADDKRCKQQMVATFKKELTEQYSQTIIQKTSEKLNELYTVQAQGRTINLFYLKENNRARIELVNDRYIVKDTNLIFSKEQMLQEVDNFPERLSPNVILRGLFQETILPNIAFVGGGGEIAYWLQLKDLFEESSICFPILVIRNSFLITPHKCLKEWSTLGFNLEALFEDTLSLEKKYVLNNTTKQIELSAHKEKMQNLYNQIQNDVSQIDITLQDHTKALYKKHLNKINALEKKMMRAEKRNMNDRIQKIRKIKSRLFPLQHLQERVDNFLPYYAQYGPSFLDQILQNSQAIDPQFCILAIE